MGLTVRERRQLTPLRRLIAERLGQSAREAVHVTLHSDIDATALVELRSRMAPDRPSIEDFVIKACGLVLQAHPAFNAWFIDGVHQFFEEVNVGIAVDTDRGLVVPVLKNVHRLTLVEITAQRRDLVERTRQWRHRPEDLEEGTFTLTNLGPWGIDAFTPIINPPQIAILGVGRMREPVGSGTVGPNANATMTLSLSFDHRVADGAAAAHFLQAIGQAIAAPDVLVGQP